jgi:hypothetical protein
MGRGQPDPSLRENKPMAHSDHGIVKDDKAQEQPTDRKRAQTAHKSQPGKSVSHEATRDPRLNDAEKTPGSRHDA